MEPERLLFDGLDLNDIANQGTYPRLELETFDPGIPPKRPDWIEGADSDGAALLRDPRFAVRKPTLTLRVRTDPQAVSRRDQAQQMISQLVAKCQKASSTPGGVTQVWTPAGATESYTMIVLDAELTEVPVTVESGYFVFEPTVSVTQTCEPALLGAEATIGAVSTVTVPVATIEAANVPGDVAANARLVVTDTASVSRSYVEWGAEQFGYTPASPSQLVLDSDQLITTGYSGTQATVAGGYDPDALTSTVISSTVLKAPQAICGTGAQTHIGTFRVRLRWRTGAAGADVFFRLQWRAGDGPYAANTAVRARSTVPDEFREIDLGLVTNPVTFAGAAAWDAQVDAWTTAGAAQNVSVDYLLLIPTEAGYGKARAPVVFERPTTLSTSDDFGFTGSLTGRVATVGGTWTGAGDADDFVGGGTTTDLSVLRTAASDVNENTGRYATLGTSSYAAGLVQVDVSFDVGPYAGKLGVLLRYTDTLNWVMATIDTLAASTVTVRKNVAGTVSVLGSTRLPGLRGYPAFYSIRLQVDTVGLWAVWVWPTGGPAGAPVGTGQDSQLATGGPLASGRPGMYDVNAQAVAVTRRYDSFYSAPLGDTNAVIFAGRALEFRYDDTIRQSADGATWGRPTEYRGARFMLRPAGDAGRTTRVVVRAHRNDLDAAPASPVADSLDVSLAYEPRFLWPR